MSQIRIYRNELQTASWRLLMSTGGFCDYYDLAACPLPQLPRLLVLQLALHAEVLSYEQLSLHRGRLLHVCNRSSAQRYHDWAPSQRQIIPPDGQ